MPTSYLFTSLRFGVVAAEVDVVDHPVGQEIPPFPAGTEVGFQGIDDAFVASDEDVDDEEEVGGPVVVFDDVDAGVVGVVDEQVALELQVVVQRLAEEPGTVVEVGW